MKTMSAGFNLESYNKIKYIWAWERKHGPRRWLLTQSVEVVLLFLLLIGYKLGKRYLFRMMAVLFQLPSWFYELIGVSSGTQTGSFGFFLLYCLMLMNAWNVWKACGRVIRCVDRDEISGSIYLMCGQWFDRIYLVWGRWSWNILMYAKGRAIVYLFALLFALIGSLGREARISVMGALGKGFVMSFFVGVLFVSLSYWYALSHRRKLRKPAASFVSGLFWIPFLLANIYKVRNVVYGFLDLLHLCVDPRVVTALDGLELLYWISPMTWMNPFIDVRMSFCFLQVGICVVLAAFATALAVKNWQEREFLC